MNVVFIITSLAVVGLIFYHLLNEVGVKFTAYLVNEHTKYKESLVATKKAAEASLVKDLLKKKEEFQAAEKEAIEKFKEMMAKTTDETIAIIQNIEDSVGDDTTKNVLIAAYKVVTVSGNCPRHQDDIELTKAVVKHKMSGGPYLSKELTLPRIRSGGGLN